MEFWRFLFLRMNRQHDYIICMTKFSKFRKLIIFSLGLVLLTVLLGVGNHFYYRSQAKEYRSYLSPDGRFRMIVYRLPMFMCMPGQSSDAPGFVRLYDQRSGRILQQKDVEMVQNIDRFEWSTTNLYIPLFADWELPK